MNGNRMKIDQNKNILISNENERSEEVLRFVKMTITNSDENKIRKNLVEKKKIETNDKVKDKILKIRNKKKPLPMKLRALPQSFWQQPNKMLAISPGSVYLDLSPLEKESNVLNSDSRSTFENHNEIVSDANTDLLFSLFRRVEEEQKKKCCVNEKIKVNKRGRPKKLKTYSEKAIRDDDPYLVSSAAESLMPLLPIKTNPDSLQSKIANSQQVLAAIINDNNTTLLSQNINGIDRNYSQILSELVVQL